MDKPNLGFSSSKYWEERYLHGGNSGSGSYGRLANFKADFLNNFFSANGVDSVLEFGCGDGNQLKLINPKRYIGIDISSTAIDKCRQIFSGVAAYKFYSTTDIQTLQKQDLTLSLDVVFHLIEEDIFNSYIMSLFEYSKRYVIIYSSNFDGKWPSIHVKHRKVSQFISNNVYGWNLSCIVPNIYPFESDNVDETSFCDFLIYSKIGCSCIVSCPAGEQ